MPKGHGCLRLALVPLMVAAVLAGGWGHNRLTHPKRFRAVEPGRLYRSAQPHGMEYGVLDSYDIERVISLRAYVDSDDLLAEEQVQCDRRSVDFVRIPVLGLLPTDSDVRKFFLAVRNSPGPVLLHCQYGKARTGFMAAAWRVAMEGWTVDAAIAEMASFKTTTTGEKGRLIRQRLSAIAANRAAWRARTAPPAQAELDSPAPTAG